MIEISIFGIVSESENFMAFLRQSLIGRGLIIALALYLFNSSIDFRDQRVAYLKEDLNLNEIESFAELIIEEIVCIDNFFEEQSEADSEPATKGANTLSYLVPSPLVLPIRPIDVSLSFYSGGIVFYYFTDSSILTPPPQHT
jgi:hypothetical protein